MTDVRLRPLAEADLVERSGYYRSEGGDIVGLRFFDAAIESSRDIERTLGPGSPMGEICGIDGRRRRRLARLVCDCFHFERGGYIDVVRFPNPARSASLGRR